MTEAETITTVSVVGDITIETEITEAATRVTAKTTGINQGVIARKTKKDTTEIIHKP